MALVKYDCFYTFQIRIPTAHVRHNNVANKDANNYL